MRYIIANDSLTHAVEVEGGSDYLAVDIAAYALGFEYENRKVKFDTWDDSQRTGSLGGENFQILSMTGFEDQLPEAIALCGAIRARSKKGRESKVRIATLASKARDLEEAQRLLSRSLGPLRSHPKICKEVHKAWDNTIEAQRKTNDLISSLMDDSYKIYDPLFRRDYLAVNPPAMTHRVHLV